MPGQSAPLNRTPVAWALLLSIKKCHCKGNTELHEVTVKQMRVK